VYLKSLEMIGFKSFADSTVLQFEPGMTCIVGPNGCGKSNVSDAVRWVLGEQSAKALRGSRMEDCIFNGTDDRKALGMAEVSISFADCESILGTEYNEVTVTRRVFRSGEGEYFLNKTPCRLKDIQRLFMDTGIGTTSYSVMEQGRIDQILSSRAEDRRTIFEEASGITKFKTDKKEAMRKLEQTEANLLRLADVIREVKRQIGSLQRQAGKARRYKEYGEELRKLDVFATREKLKLLDEDIRRIESEGTALARQIASCAREVGEMDEGSSVLRKSVVQTEHEIGIVLEQAVQAQGRLDHTREMIALNGQRIAEYRAWCDRGSQEMGEAAKRIAEKRAMLQELAPQAAAARSDLGEAQQRLEACQEACERGRAQVETLRDRVRLLRDESVETESLLARLHNQLVELESRERSAAVRRERLAAEKSQLSRDVAQYEERQADMSRALVELQGQVVAREAIASRLEADRGSAAAALADLQQKLAEMRARGCAAEARVELLSRDEAGSAAPPVEPAALLEKSGLAGAQRQAVLGTLRSLIEVDPPYAAAAEAALRESLDAVLIRDTGVALAALRRIEAAGAGPARLLATDRAGARPPAAPDGDRLAEHVRCPDSVRPVLSWLIGGVVVVDSLDGLRPPTDPSLACVTRSGALVRGDGWMEFRTDAAASASRRAMLADARREMRDCEDRASACRDLLAAARSALERADDGLARGRKDLDEPRRALAQKEGESQVVTAEANEARARLETVAWELNEIASRDGAGGETREASERQMAETNEQIRRAETEHAALQVQLTEQKIRVASLAQRLETTLAQQSAAEARIAELEAGAEDRARDIASHHGRIAELEGAIAAAEAQLSSLEQSLREQNDRADSLRKSREKQGTELESLERLLATRRAALDESRAAKSALDVQAAETRMRRQNQLDRVASEHGIAADQIEKEPEPDWPDGVRPSLDSTETMIAELRTKMDAMGPVNLVAIEEYKELEARCAFLTAQETDLVNSKQQLKEMIRKINRTTSDMFRSTFDRVNENFLVMFRKLFNGGSAKLVLVNEEDVLECGIEIIAKPPGKRLQNVSLLSGGERTLTAVALLFSIYMIKPSPFCLLDELDAALDDSNIGRFVGVLQGFLGQSQFVVITHNRQTIAAGRTLYGVTMPEKGISKIVSMRFKDRAREQPVSSEVGN
jgi:chromosome segregation protein